MESTQKDRAENFDKEPFNPFATETMDNASYATRPGLIPLSQDCLQALNPEVFAIPAWMFWMRKGYKNYQFIKKHVAEHLRYGLAEPALVVQLEPLLIAAYTEELDCVAFLSYFSKANPDPEDDVFYPEGLADNLIEKYQLQVGSRLLAVNTFQDIDEGGYAPDLRPGPNARGIYGNFAPYIADLLTADTEVLEERKQLMEDSEWQRCQQLADDFFTHVANRAVKPRDGRPLASSLGHPQDWLPGHAP